MKPITLIVLFTILSLSLHGQLFDKSYYTKGTIITKKDTIKAYIDVNDEAFGYKIKYKLNQEDKKVLRVLTDSVVYLKTTLGTYERVEINKTSSLMKLLEKGAVSLYKNIYMRAAAPMYNGASGTFINGGSSEKVEYYLLYNSESYKVKKRTLKEKLKSLMADYPEIVTDIEAVKFKNLFLEIDLKKIVSKYNRYKKMNNG